MISANLGEARPSTHRFNGVDFRHAARGCATVASQGAIASARIVGVLLLCILSGCAFSPPKVVRLGGADLADGDVTTIQLAGHPGKQEGGLIFEEIDGKRINDIEPLTQKGYFLNDAFHFNVPVVIQLPPGKHDFLLRFEYIGLQSLTRFQMTMETKPCAQRVSIDGKPGTLYVVDWKPVGTCADLAMSQEPFGKIHAR